MKPNALRSKLAASEPVFGTMVQDVRSPSIGQILALAGCDFVFFDMEHGPFDLRTIADMIRVARLAGIQAKLCRVEGHLYHLGVPGRLAADLLVGRVRDRAAGIARDHVHHALQFVVDRLQAPEAAAAEGNRR